MKTLDRYLSGIFLKNLVVAVLGLTAFYLFQSLLGQLMDQKYPSHQVLWHSFLGIPHVVTQMAPPAVMMATVFTLSGLNRTAELTACYAIGIGLNRIFGVILSLVFMFSCFLLVMQDRILPPLYKKQKTYYWREMEKKTDFFLDVKQDKIWYRSKNLVYNLRSFDNLTRTIHGMAVYTFDEDFNLLQVVNADRAAFTPTGWKLQKGTVTVFPKDDPFPLTKQFEQKELQIAETPKDFQEIEKEVDGLRLKELLQYIDRSQQAGADTKDYRVKFHSRISLSFIPLVMCAMAVPFSVRGRREGGVAKDLAACFVVTFFYWLFYSIGLSLGTNGALPPWLAAWLPSTIFAAVAVTLIARQNR